jgi:hypothetical protein
MKSSISRLAALPDVFHGTDVLLRCHVPKAQINQLLWRWKNAGHIQSLGERSDAWFNLIKDQDITRTRWERAVRMAMPSAISAGHAVLMQAGLSTQMTSKDYLIRPARSSMAQITGAEVHERPAVWIKHLRRFGAVHSPDTACGLARLEPGAALLDLLAFEPQSIDEEDIEWDELDESDVNTYQALMPLAEKLSKRELPAIVIARHPGGARNQILSNSQAAKGRT